ncbi:hypothetical protein [Moraxella caviae]|uniref:hypothetical protein n=1 Tax=Moraxella caviae TaxID=34060 RepID=UPI0013EFA1B7|nr:hypothetical protein [Moraxella caviae]
MIDLPTGASGNFTIDTTGKPFWFFMLKSEGNDNDLTFDPRIRATLGGKRLSYSNRSNKNYALYVGVSSID